MPRYREPYTVFPRELKSGKAVYYYRTYTPDGQRTVAHSTGKTNKTQAKCYCAELLSKGLLYSGTTISFGVYAKNFFSEGSQWLSDKIQAGQGKTQPIAENTLKAYRHSLDSYLLPFFSKIKLDDIRPSHIKKFRSSLIEKGLSNSVINLSCTCLKIILSYAKAERLMTSDPFVSVPAMYVNAKSKDAYTRSELKDIFGTRWESNERKLFSLVAAVTGLRISEVSAIRRETLYSSYIEVKDQLCGNKIMPVKDGEKRKVPVCEVLHRMLSESIRRNGDFAFTEAQDTYRNSFYRHCKTSDVERHQKGLTFHSLRHFFNTTLLNEGIPEIKVKAVMGHSSGKGSMTERYANFRIEDFDDVLKIQSKLLEEFII